MVMQNKTVCFLSGKHLDAKKYLSVSNHHYSFIVKPFVYLHGCELTPCFVGNGLGSYLVITWLWRK